MSRTSPPTTVTFTFQGERVALELPTASYREYLARAAHMRVPVEAVIRRDLRPLLEEARQHRRRRLLAERDTVRE